MKSKILLLLIFLFVNGIQGFAGFADSSVIQIFTQIYNQNFDEAGKTLLNKKPEMDAFYFQLLTFDFYWWKYSMSRSKEDAANLKKALESADVKSLDSTRQKMLTLIKTSYHFRFEVKRLNIIEAMFIRSDISSQLVEIKNGDLQFYGEEQELFDLYISLLEYSYNSVNPFFSKSKSEACRASLSKIEIYTNHNDLIVQTLARYFLGRIYMKVENKPEMAKEQFEILSKEYPLNPYFADLAATL